MQEKPILTLMVGLPGAGKTTAARQLEEETGAIRFTPDEWHLFLFGNDFHDPAQHALHDSRHDRVEELWRRLEARNREDRNDVFQTITREDLEEWAALFQEPDQAELRGEYR